MKKILMIVLVLVSVPILGAEERPLPKPASHLGVDLITAIECRKSFRSFTGKQIPEEDLSTILWSALGVTWRPGEKASIHGVDATTGATLGERRATVFAWEPTITAYVLLPEGAFRYEPVQHALVEVSPHDLRDSAARQSFPGRAAVIILAATGEILDHLPGPQEDKLAWANTTAGLAAQNIYLTSTALGYGTVLIWYVNRSSLPSALGLTNKDQLLYALPLGSVELEKPAGPSEPPAPPQRPWPLEEVSANGESSKKPKGSEDADPSGSTEASYRRSHWPAVPNPRISVWSIVDFNSLHSSSCVKVKRRFGNLSQV